MRRFLLLPLMAVILCASMLFSQSTKENADFKLAVNLYNDKLYDLALEQFKQFVATFPNTQQGLEARFYLGLTQTKLQQHDDARLTFQNFALAFPDHPKSPEAWWNVGEAYVSLENSREAALAFERVRTFHPKSKLAPSALLKSSEYFSIAGDPENARKVLRTLVQEYSASDIVVPARLKLAEIYLVQNQFELARSECKRVIDAKGDATSASRAHYLMAIALVRLNKTEEAKSSLTTITSTYRSSSSYHDALFLLGTIHRDTGELSDAETAWRSIVNDSLRATPQMRQNAMFELGITATTSGSYDAAVRYFERATTLKGTLSGDAFYRAAVSAERGSQFGKASAYYLRAERDTTTRVDPRALIVGGMKGSNFAQNYNQALEFAQQFRNRFPSDPLLPRVLMEAATIYRKQLNDERHAVDMLEEVFNRFPTHPLADDALFEMAKVHQQFGSSTQALEALESLERRFPGSDHIDEARRLRKSIRIYDVKESADGLSNLALLIGEMIDQKPPAMLAFRLGEIFFTDLKDYAKAAAQFETALRNPLPAQTRAQAWYYKSKALEYVSRKLDQSSPRFADAANAAIAAYDSLNAQNLDRERASEAFLSKLRLQLDLSGSVAEVRRVAEEIERSAQNIARRDQALFLIAQRYQSIRAFAEANSTYRTVIDRHGQSDVIPEALFQRARVLLDLAQQDSAMVLLNAFRTRFPDHRYAAQASYQLAMNEASRRNFAQAHRLFDALEERYPYSEFASDLDTKRGDAYYFAEDFANARVRYERVIERKESDPFSLSDVTVTDIIRLAQCYEKLGDASRAKRYYAISLIKDSSATTRGTAYYALAGIARQENNLELAARLLEQASRVQSPSGDQAGRASLEAAHLLFESGDYAGALRRYTELLQQARTDSVRQYLESRVIITNLRLDNIPESDRRIQAFVKSYPKAAGSAAEFEYERGRYHLRKDDLDAAFRRFEIVTRQYPRSSIFPDALYWTGRVHETLNRQQQAIQTYESVIQQFPNEAITLRAHLSLGNVYFALEQWENASKQYRTILENERRAPDLIPFAMNNLILTNKQIGLWDAALQLTRQYIDRYPDNADIGEKRIDIGVIYQKLGYYDQSILHLQSLLENVDADIEAEVRYYIGEAFFFKGDYQQAILEFLKVPYLVTKRTKIDWVAPSYYMSGQSYEKMAKYDQAITMYRQIIDRSGIDASLKTAAQKEIDRVNALVRSQR